MIYMVEMALLDTAARRVGGLGASRRFTPRNRPSWRSSRDLGEEEHLAVGTDRLEQGVLEDLAVDGDRHARLEMGGERRMELAELAEELLDGRRREIELGDAPGHLREVADQHHSRHAVVAQALLRPLSLSAFNTLGGDIGSSVKRMPVAFSIALAMAPSGGTIGVSPTPRTP